MNQLKTNTRNAGSKYKVLWCGCCKVLKCYLDYCVRFVFGLYDNYI